MMMRSVCVKSVIAVIFVAVLIAIFTSRLLHNHNSAKPGSITQEAKANPNSNTTFRACSDTKPEPFKSDPHHYWDQNPAAVQFGRGLKPFIINHLGEILQSTQFPRMTVESGNGFVLSVLEAYDRHHNLVIRPDDVWAAIMTQFSFYINKRSEEFRHKFVNFPGETELVVDNIPVGFSMRSATPPHEWFVREITRKIHNLVDSPTGTLAGPSVNTWILPGFSTTTDNDVLTVGLIFMGTMAKYFDYTERFWMKEENEVNPCGIPWFTLEGTVDDWTNIYYMRLGMLSGFKLDTWVAMLRLILKQFVRAKKEGYVDGDFWKRICYSRGGSEGGVSQISGWISAFAAFNEQGDWQIDSTQGINSSDIIRDGNDENEALKPLMNHWLDVDDIPSGMVQVNVKIVGDNNGGVIHKGMMLGGHVGMEQLEDNMTLKPSLGWILALKKEEGV